MLVYDTLTRWAITGAGRFAAPIIESLVNLVRVEDTMISAILFAWNNFNLFKNCIHGTNDREKYFDKIGRRRISPKIDRLLYYGRVYRSEETRSKLRIFAFRRVRNIK